MFKVYLSPTQVILVTLPACPTPFQYYILSTTMDSKSLIRYILNLLKKIKENRYKARIYTNKIYF